MRKLYLTLNRSFLIILLFVAGACVPKAGGKSSGKTSEADAFAITTILVGPGSIAIQPISGAYYSKYDPVVFNGSCAGNVHQVTVQETPQAGVMVSQTVPCSNGTFSWSKSLPVENAYAIVLTPQDSTGTPISSLTPISKNYTYDITNPIAPQFATPTVTNHYTITNGNASITITGQVLNDVVTLVGPYSIILPLMSDPDGIHKDFAFNATVPASTSVNFTFTASDAATNSSSSTLTIDSVLNLSIPVAAQELGGSHATSGSLMIESTAGFMSTVIVNSNVKQAIGSAGIMGNL
jgi:hypothetical protein